MNQPTPALVTQRAATRLPRAVLLLLCAVYVLPGLFGRDPWRNADLTAYGYMLGLAEGRMSWWSPSLGGLAPEPALLPHWLGAWAIQALGPWLGSAFAARLPFAALLAATLSLIWYTTYYLARSDAAQPVPFAFGGEAEPVSYARATADGALLASIAALGLLQLGHETTPELVQLSLVSLLMWSIAAAPFQIALAPWALLVSLPLMSLSGSPSLAVVLGLLAGPLCLRSSHGEVRKLWIFALVSLVIAASLATWINSWQWRVALRATPHEWLGIARLWLWFTWPVLPMAGWTLWRWRSHWPFRHIAIPLITASVGLAASVVMNGSEKALLLSLPGLAILAAFALPTLTRSAGAAMDWFSVFFFSASALTLWVIYASIQFGVPAQPLINILRLVPGFEPNYSSTELIFALCGTAAWIGLVRWRTSRHRHPIWKSLVLPASGVALSWLLAMTLMLPVIDYARSTRPLVQQISRWVPSGQCIRAPALSRTHIAGLEVFGRFKVHAEETEVTRCEYLLTMSRSPGSKIPEGWILLTRIRRPVDRTEYFSLYQRRHANPAQSS